MVKNLPIMKCISVCVWLGLVAYNEALLGCDADPKLLIYTKYGMPTNFYTPRDDVGKLNRGKITKLVILKPVVHFHASASSRSAVSLSRHSYESKTDGVYKSADAPYTNIL